MHQRTRAKKFIAARSYQHLEKISSSDTSDSSVPRKRQHAEMGESNRSSQDHHEEPFNQSHPFLLKEPKYEVHRARVAEEYRTQPELLQPRTIPFNFKFITEAAYERYLKFRKRKFIVLKFLLLDVENLQDVKDIVVDSGNIYTVIDVDPFVPNLICEFLANLGDAEEQIGGCGVYVRGSMYELSPSLIDLVYELSPGRWDYEMYLENIDSVCAFLTNGRHQRWEGMCSKYLTSINQVLYKLCCSNWMPNMNYKSMNQDRLKFIYSIHNKKGADFGFLVYRLIQAMANNEDDVQQRIDFPTLITQLLNAQRIVPRHKGDEKVTGHPIDEIKDKKAGRGGTSGSAQPPNLADDLQKVIDSLRAIQLRC